MSAVACLAGLSGLVQGLCGLVGTFLLYLCLSHPETVVQRLPEGLSLGRDQLRELSASSQPRQDNGTVNRQPDDLSLLTCRLSTDPDRDVVFCLAIACSLFNLIWSLSSLLLLLGCKTRSARLLWQWVLCSIAVGLLHLLGAAYFTVKAARHVMSFDQWQEEEHWSQELDHRAKMFLKYGYPFILLAVFSGGIITWPINILLSFLVKRKAEQYFFADEDKVSANGLESPAAQKVVMAKRNGSEGKTSSGTTSAGSSTDAVYVNHSFSPDEKY